MKFRVRYYALLREMVGKDSEEFVADSCHVSVGEVLESVARVRPELRELVFSGRVLVIHGGSIIRDPDERLDLCSEPTVDLVPPSAGGGGTHEAHLVLGRTVDVEGFLKNLLTKLDPESGAIAVFLGVVKGSVEDSRVEELRYEYHAEYTERALERIASEASRTEGVKHVAVYHSVGTFKPGDAVFAVGVVGVGRKAAIGVLREVVERVKHEAAIWKVEKRGDGTFWVLGDGERVPVRPKNPRAARPGEQTAE